MARPLRFVYPGAVYHVMARGDGGKAIFETLPDHQVFIARLGQACLRCGWQVHAWVLMKNHFHLLLETPEPNLVVGMKWLLGTFSQGWNASRQRHGHVFQGRYKAIPVNASDGNGRYFKTVADYIHLNPARARIAGGEHGALASYRWSSLAYYSKGPAPSWLKMDTVLASLDLVNDTKGRRAYVAWLEAKAATKDSAADEQATAALRRGWYHGDGAFRDHLLAMISPPHRPISTGGSGGESAARGHHEREAERLVVVASGILGLPAEANELARLRKGDKRKIVLAALLREKTTASNAWIAGCLQMGHPAAISRLVRSVRSDKMLARELADLEKCLNARTDPIRQRDKK